MDQIGIVYSKIHLLGIIQVDSSDYFVVAVTNLLPLLQMFLSIYIVMIERVPLLLLWSEHDIKLSQ